MNNDDNCSNNNNNNIEIKVELNIDISCQSCIDSIDKAINDKLKNTKIIETDIPDQRMVLQGTDLTQDILETIKGTGRNVSICGLSGVTTNSNNTCHKKQQQEQQEQQEQTTGSAVCSLGLIEGWEKGCGGSGGLGSKGVYGIIRLLRASATKTLFEGRVTGLKPGRHSLVVHEFGNLTNGCDNLGEPYTNNDNNNNNSSGDDKVNKCKEIINSIIGTSMVTQDGKAEFRVLTEDNKYDFWDLIGRSIVIHSRDAKYLPSDHQQQSLSESDKIIGERVACGIISRAASVGQNHKKVCPCDGSTAI